MWVPFTIHLFMVNLNQELNRSQLEAVTVIDGPVLVIAGAGSGKTRVIEYRVLNLIQKGIPAPSILLLTFTREASRKMLERATKRDVRCKNVEGGTFHSFAYKLLKQYGSAIGLPPTFSIIDEADSIDAIQRCAASMGLPDKKGDFPKKDTLKTIISSVINKNISVEHILRKEYPDFIECGKNIENLAKKYAEFKKQKALLDYDDLLVYCRDLLQNDKIKETVAGKYRYIMIDEYQDTNKIQADIAYLLAEKHNNIMAVGDDAQSIYGFRGASHKNIMEFPKLFKGCKVIKLEENYRSTQSILDLANSVLENMENKYSKCLISARKQMGDKNRLMFFNDAYSEAEWIADKIIESHDTGMRLCDQAVLFRSAYISIPLQAELSKRGVPYQVFGGLKFYETAHVKDLMAHLKVMHNPKDILSWNRVLMLTDGIGAKTSEKILKDIDVYSNLDDILKNSFRQHLDKNKISEGLKRVKNAFEAASDRELNPSEKFEIALTHYMPILKEKFDDWQLRRNDLEVLKQIAERYESLEELLADFAIEPDQRGGVRINSDPVLDKPLTLSTIHSAKGLEWDSVFVLGLMEGVFPVSFSLNDEEEIEEEHRLFYVAVTRAKNNLLLSLHYEGNRGGMFQFNKASRFIDNPDILSNLKKDVMLEPDL